MSVASVRLERWEEIEREIVTNGIARQLFTGKRMMLAHVHLDKGAVVPKHVHENEQLTWIVRGSMKFWLGEGDEIKELILSAGDVLYIPSNVPHKAEALEDTLDVDIFSPPRQDWLDGTDTYFRNQ